MFCTKCGKRLPRGAKYCPNCAAPVTGNGKTLKTPKKIRHTAPVRPSGATGTPPRRENRLSQLWAAFLARLEGLDLGRVPSPVAIAALVVAVLLIGTVVWGAVYQSRHQRERDEACQALLTEGREDLDAGEYESAADAFQDALELCPDSLDASIGLGEAYLYLGQFEQARDVLLALEIDPKAENYAHWQWLQSVASLDPEITGVDVEGFPVVTVSLDWGTSVPLTRQTLKVSEDGEEQQVTDFQLLDGVATFTYETREAIYGPEQRKITLDLTPEGFSLTCSGSYEAPYFEAAQLTLVSADVSKYPTVRAYFRIENGNGTATGLDAESFLLREGTPGGEMNQREVTAAYPQEGQGLNISLVADQSDSITDDLYKLQNALSDFVRGLDFAGGDMAELVAFGSTARQVCGYTGDAELLLDGIDGLAADGMSAFYDAVYMAVQNAALQGGARCVIAITDGMDNESSHTAKDVIELANTRQVPVYVVGVGDAGYDHAGILRGVAEDTGGTYWLLEDLDELGDVYSQIYARQQTLWVVEYESDSALEQYASREVQVSITGGGYKGELTASFTPARTTRSEYGDDGEDRL